MNGSRDSEHARFWLGNAIPASLVAVAIAGVIFRRAIFFGPGGTRSLSLRIYSEPMQVAGIVILELGFACGMFSWFNLANEDSRERLVLPMLIGGIVLAICGLVLFVVGAFR